MRSDHGGEFENESFKTFFLMRMISPVIFHVKKLLNIMGLLKGKIEHCEKWLGH